MFYQDNNDYMRDSYFYGNGMNSGMCGMQNIQGFQNPYMQANYQMPMQMNQTQVPLENMYPQIYRIINPVANRVISNSNSQFMTEDLLNNMTDTVYNIVEGDVSSLISDSNNQNLSSGDDTVQVNGNNRGIANNSNSNTAERRTASNTTNNQGNSNNLLKDLIKIIIIKNLLARRNNNYSNSNFMQGQLPMSYYNPMGYGMF